MVVQAFQRPFNAESTVRCTSNAWLTVGPAAAAAAAAIAQLPDGEEAHLGSVQFLHTRAGPRIMVVARTVSRTTTRAPGRSQSTGAETGAYVACRRSVPT